MKSGAAGNSKQKPDKSAYDFLKNYLDTHKKYTWLAIAGVWKPTPGKYRYKRIPLQFPDSIVAKVNGEFMYYTYTRTQQGGRVSHKAGAIIPASKTARAMMDDWLKAGTKKQPPTTAKPSEGPGLVLSQVEDNDCGVLEGEEICRVKFPDGEWVSFECDVSVTCADAPDDGSGEYDDWPPDDWPPPDDDDGDGSGDSTCPTCGGGGDDGSDSGDDDDNSDEENNCISETGKAIPCEELVPTDCAGVEGGTAYIDNCGTCVGGTTGKISCCATFDKIMKTVFDSEGEEYVNDPDDPGGPTKLGITFDNWKFYSHYVDKEPTLNSLKELSIGDAKVIYQNTFWVWSQADRIKDGDLSKMFFDFYVNAPKSSVLRLQESLNALGYNISKDGGMGDETLGAIEQAVRDGNLTGLYNTYKTKRVNWYKNRNKKFSDGLVNRANKFNDKTEFNKHGVNCDV